MTKKLGLYTAFVIGSVVVPIQAAVNIGPNVIVRGTTIEVGGPGPDLQDIIDGITDAAADKPYLIKLGAGNFTIDETLVMSPFVSIMGNGSAVTIVKGEISTSVEDATSSIISVANNTALTDLRVENTGGSSVSIAIAIIGKENTSIERVAAVATGGSTDNYGVFYSSASDSNLLAQVTAIGSGGSTNSGVYNKASAPFMTNVIALSPGGLAVSGVFNDVSSTPVMTNVIATGSEGQNSTYGVRNINSAPIMNNVVATASGLNFCIGVGNVFSSPIMTNVFAKGLGGTLNYGVYNFQSAAAPIIENSSLEGSTDGMRFGGSGGTRIANTRIVGGIDADPGGVQCRNTYDADLNDVNC